MTDLYKPEEYERIQTCICFLPLILSTLVNSCGTFCPLPQKRVKKPFYNYTGQQISKHFLYLWWICYWFVCIYLFVCIYEVRKGT